MMTRNLRAFDINTLLVTRLDDHSEYTVYLWDNNSLQNLPTILFQKIHQTAVLSGSIFKTDRENGEL